MSQGDPFLRVDGLSKAFDGTVAVADVSLALPQGRTLALLGPSGSGKTTTLRLLAGFETPDAGRITVDGADVTRLAPVARRFGMVFQHYALFPHMDVGHNVAFGLESLGVRGAELQRRVEAALEQVDLAGYARRRVNQLSGGQQQRVAVARALAPEPRVLLLDEPLSNLDPALRERTRRELRRVIDRIGITTVIVTHEQEEAFDLGESIAVLRNGRLEQVGSPDSLYQTPATSFVAGFIGRASRLAATVERVSAEAVSVRVGSAQWSLPAAAVRAGRPVAGAAVELLVRPEALALASAEGAGLRGEVVERRFTGALAFFQVRTEEGLLLEVSAPSGATRVGARVGLVPGSSGIHLFAAPEAVA